jgi:hypothetical protein
MGNKRSLTAKDAKDAKEKQIQRKNDSLLLVNLEFLAVAFPLRPSRPLRFKIE